MNIYRADHPRTVFRSVSRAYRIKFDSEFSKYRRLILPDVARESGGKRREGRDGIDPLFKRYRKEKDCSSKLRMASFHLRLHRITKFILCRRCQHRPSNYFEQDPI